MYAAKDTRTGEVVAIKKLKIHEPEHGFPLISFREINILRQVQRISPHPNIVNLKEVVVGAKSESIFLVFEYCEMDLGHLVDQLAMDKIFFSECEIKCIMLQILNSVLHLHRNFIIHRDLKLSNILVNYNGIMKLADFGLSKSFGKGAAECRVRPEPIHQGSGHLVLPGARDHSGTRLRPQVRHVVTWLHLRGAAELRQTNNARKERGASVRTHLRQYRYAAPH